MIKLENLHVELGKKIFTPKDRKYLRVSICIHSFIIANIVKNIVKPATIINESSLSWDEEMTLPILFKQ